MKITKNKLIQIIKEEIDKVKESYAADAPGAGTGRQQQLLHKLKDWDLKRLQDALYVIKSMGPLMNPTEKEFEMAIQTLIGEKPGGLTESKIAKIGDKIKNTSWESLDSQMAADMKAKYIRKLTSAGHHDPENYFIAAQSGKI